MSVEDRQTARLLMRELGRRRHLDLSEVKVSVSKGIGYIAGIIRPMMGEYMDPKAEVKAIMDGVKRVPGLKDVSLEAKFVVDSKK